MNDEGIPVDIDHVIHSVGGAGGHFFRRLLHISMAVIPVLYYTKGEDISSIISISPTQLVILICFTILSLEAIRLKFGIIIIGQREYEETQISALAWGAFAVCLALLITPQEGSGMKSGLYGAPIIWGLTFVDPVMGEIKRKKQGIQAAIIGGLIISFIIWIGSSFWLGTPLWIALILAPFTVLGELPRVKWIDDNATMMLGPLTILFLLQPFI